MNTEIRKMESRFVKVSSHSRPAAKSYVLTAICPTPRAGFSSASNLNRVGRVVGQSSSGQRSPIHAFCWDNMGGLVPSIGTLAERNTVATNINVHGLIVGYAEAKNGMLRAFVSDSTQVFDLGLLCDPKVDGAFSVATDLNAEAQVVGYSHNPQGGAPRFYLGRGQRDVRFGDIGGRQELRLCDQRRRAGRRLVSNPR